MTASGPIAELSTDQRLFSAKMAMLAALRGFVEELARVDDDEADGLVGELVDAFVNTPTD